MRGRERVGPGLKSVYGTKVSERARSVNLSLHVFSSPGQVRSFSPAPESQSCGVGSIVSGTGCVFTCVGISVFVVTGSLNSTVPA